MYLRLLIKSKRGISCFPSFFEVQSPVFFHARHPPPPAPQCGFASFRLLLFITLHSFRYSSSSTFSSPFIFLSFLSSCSPSLLPHSFAAIILSPSRCPFPYVESTLLPRDRSLPAHPISTLKAQSRKKPTNLCAPRELRKEMRGPCLMIIKPC